jgi:asparagine synthase (glutamine-hydrolysing)
MDSSSVVCFAREWMKAGVGPAKLHTLTSVYERPNLAGERAYADMVIQQGGNLQPHWVNADEAISFRWFDQGIPYHDEPFMGLPFLRMETLLIEVASQLGIDVILTGIGSDDFICGAGLGLADQLRRGQWRAALMAASQMAREQSSNFWSILVEQGLKPASLLLTLGGPTTQLRRGFSQWPHLNDFSIAPWILPEFAQKYQMHRVGIGNAKQMYGGSVVTSSDIGAVKALAGDWTSWFLAAPQGMHYSHPFRDARVAKFCLQLPPTLKDIPGLPKPVLQTAMQGILPEAIRTRKKGSSFNDCYWVGLSRHLPQLEAMIQASRIDEVGMVDKPHLIYCMQQAAIGIGKMPAITRINTTLSLIAWFDQMLETWHQPAELPCEVHRLDAVAAFTH